MIRVFHLIKSLGRGGAEVLLSEGLRFAERARFEFAYGYFLPWKDALEAPLVAQGVDVVCFGRRTRLGILASAAAVARTVRAQEADILHCHLPLAGVVGRLAGRMAGVPVVYTEHNTLERYHPITRRLNLLSWSWQERVIAVSSEVAESVRRHVNGHVPVHVVPNGIDLNAFNVRGSDGSATRHRLGIDDEEAVIGTVAVFRKQKALEHWLSAAVSIHKRFPRTRFLLVGDGPLRNELEELARHSGLGDAVLFTGLQDDVRPFISAMDVYVMSSRFEGLPVALLEAMAMQRAVVATAVGGIPEVIEDGLNGILVPPERPQALAEAVCTLLESPSLRARLGERARYTCEARYSMSTMARELEAIYTEVAAAVV